MMLSDELIQQLSLCVDAGKCRTDAASLEQYGKDWTKHHTPMPSAIVFPTTVEQVQSIVRFAKEHQLAIVPSGGRTGLSGGAVAYQGEIVVSFDYMNKILEFNALDQSVRVEAGVVTEVLQQFATEQGLFYPVDFASSGSSQIGGNIATNAGGIKVVRYGLTRDWVLGLTVVTGTGEILSLNQGLIKNATGYDFRHLLIGSEGTLGLIVEATIRLTKPPEHLTAMVLGVSDFDALMQVFHASRSQLTLTAFEFFSDKALNRVVARGDVPRPFAGDFPFYVLLEFEKDSEQKEADMLALFEHCVENGWVQEGVISQSETQYVQLWRLREDISETLSAFTPYKNDLSVKVSQVPAFLNEIDQVVSREYPEFELVWFGHIGDGNLHLNILKPETWEKTAFFTECHRVSLMVFDAVKKYSGSVSAEHGVGLLKKMALPYSRSEEEIRLMRAVKQVFDPGNILNPGKIFD